MYLVPFVRTVTGWALGSEKRIGPYLLNLCHTVYIKVFNTIRCKKCKGAKTVSESKKVAKDNLVQGSSLTLTRSNSRLKKACRTERELHWRGRATKRCVLLDHHPPSLSIFLQQPGRETSDLVFILRTKEHSSFSRSGADLMITISITLSEALTGFNRVLLTHLDGRGIRVVSKPNKLIRSGEWIKVPRLVHFFNLCLARRHYYW